MRFFIFIILIFLFEHSVAQTDTAYRRKYQLNPYRDGVVLNQFVLKDSSTILVTNSTSGGTENGLPDSYNIIRLGPAGNVVWAKRFKEYSGNYFCGIRNVMLLKDGTILLIGTFVSTNPQSNDFSRKFFLSKINNTGAIVWSKNYNTNFNLETEISYPVFAEADNGDIFCAFSLNSIVSYQPLKRISGPYITKFDNSGNLLWDNLFSSKSVSCAPTSLFIEQNKQCYVLGNFIDWLPPLYNTYELYLVALKLETSKGSVIKSVKYKLPNAAQTSTDKTDGKGHLYFQNNKLRNISYLSATFPATFESKTLYQACLVTDLDTNLNFLQSKRILQNDILPKSVFASTGNSYRYNINVTQWGDILMGITGIQYNDSPLLWGDTLYSYAAKLNSSFNVQWQKKFFIPSPRNINLEPVSVLEKTNCSAQVVLNHITKYDLNTLHRSFEVINFNPAIKYNNPCLGEDTSFIEVNDVSLEQTSFFWDEEFTNILLPFNATLVLEDIPVTQTELCRIESDCSNFSLTGPDSTCTGVNINLQLHKQSNCLLPVGWQLPSVAVADTFLLNDTTLSIRFKQPWQGTIYSYAGDCNTVIDSLFITVLPKPVPVDIGKDTLLCNNNPVLLKAGAAYKTYLWNTGSRDSLLTVSTAGKYWISVTDYCGTVSTDTIDVKERIYSFIIEKDTTICKGDTVLLQATTGYINYQWIPTYYLSGSVSPSVLSYPESNTRYTVSAQTITGCTLEASVFVKVMLCPETCFVPNSFTPNGDGNNDLFKPIIEGSLSAYQFSIFNRYGQQVFSSTESGKGWDGTFRSVLQISGTFIWQLSYTFKNRKPQFKKGTVLLLR